MNAARGIKGKGSFLFMAKEIDSIGPPVSAPYGKPGKRNPFIP